jgi:hypothetical protein
MTNQRPRVTLRAPRADSVLSVAFSPDGKLLAAGLQFNEEPQTLQAAGDRL